MKRYLISLTVLASITLNISGQNIPVYSFNEFESKLYHQTDSLYFINFWATWCVPCVKEIPAINEIAEKYAGTKLKIIMVSLDMPNHIESRLIPFIEKMNIKSDIILLDDPDFNSWIDKVDTNWTGGIPASLIYSKNSREFFEQSFEFEELDSIINYKLNKL